MANTNNPDKNDKLNGGFEIEELYDNMNNDKEEHIHPEKLQSIKNTTKKKIRYPPPPSNSK